MEPESREGEYKKPVILYEDRDVLVINKPAGLIVHSDGRTVEPTVADWVVAHYPEMKEVGEPWISPQDVLIPRPGIVHRLDRTTSGVMILAKTKEAYLFLKKQFQDRTVEKEYRAIVWGHPKEDSGLIEREIVRIRSVPPRWGVSHGVENKKRAAVTYWSVLRRVADPESGEKVSVLTLRPRTGRTHQLRVHLAALGYPIVSDHIYAALKPQILGFLRPALHATTLSLSLPSGERRVFEAPLPDDFVQAEQSLSARG